MSLGTRDVLISSERLRELSKLGYLGCTLDIVFAWVSIAAAAWVSQRYWSPALYILTVMWIGGRQYALATLMHDASHWRLYNNRKLNDLVGEAICAWPLFFRMGAYRIRHIAHHKNVGIPGMDPEVKRWRYPESRRELITMLILDLFGLNTLQLLADARELEQEPVTRKTQVLRILYYAAIFCAITYFGVWKTALLYWFVPFLTWWKAVLRIRAAADHAGLPKSVNGAMYSTRTTIPTLFERLFIAPRAISYHTGHHLFMSVPSKNLRKLHEELSKKEAYRSRSRVTRGYFGLLSELPKVASQ